MPTDVAWVALAPQAAVSGACELCGQEPVDLLWTVIVHDPRAGAGRASFPAAPRYRDADARWPGGVPGAQSRSGHQLWLYLDLHWQQGRRRPQRGG
jgi:hypothetical protein